MIPYEYTANRFISRPQGNVLESSKGFFINGGYVATFTTMLITGLLQTFTHISHIFTIAFPNDIPEHDILVGV